jgi:hypothetical protein
MATANILVDFNGTGFAAFLPAPVEKRSKKLLLQGPGGKKGHLMEIHPAETMFQQRFELFPPKMKSRV